MSVSFFGISSDHPLAFSRRGAHEVGYCLKDALPNLATLHIPCSEHFISAPGCNQRGLASMALRKQTRRALDVGVIDHERYAVDIG